MANIWHDIDVSRICPDRFTAFIEISKGSKMKYELDKETGMLMLDRLMSTSTQYPWNYGLIPRTLAPDHDPLDVLVICSEPIVPNSLVECIPIGVIKMKDGGEQDDKILAIFPGDPNYKHIRDFSELPLHIFDEIMHFFSVYKQLEGKVTVVEGRYGPDEAKKIIVDCMTRYNDKFKN